MKPEYRHASQEVTKDIYTRVTETVINMMEKVEDKWEKPWITVGHNIMMPKNAVTNKDYNGVNVVMLWASAEMAGYTDGRWASFKQWQEKGAQVRKGEKGTPIVFYKELDRKKDEGDEEKPDKFLMAKMSFVFNAAQVDGFKAPELPVIKSPAQRIEAVERFIQNTRAVVEYGGDRAFYRPSDDIIRLPEITRFKTTEGFQSTVLHELTHWTGAKKRLDREIVNKFGTKEYAREELVAEIGSAFLCAKLEITKHPRKDHAQYLKSWLEVLKEDNKAIFTASSQAQKAVNYLFDLQPK